MMTDMQMSQMWVRTPSDTVNWAYYCSCDRDLHFNKAVRGKRGVYLKPPNTRLQSIMYDAAWNRALLINPSVLEDELTLFIFNTLLNAVHALINRGMCFLAGVLFICSTFLNVTYSMLKSKWWRWFLHLLVLCVFALASYKAALH